MTSILNKIKKRINIITTNSQYSLCGKKYYGQQGEDAILYSIFNDMIINSISGFYIDIGAFHPTKYSNTKIFYDLGWHGINIEPLKSNYNLFIKQRTKDINLNIGISSKSEEKKFHVFDYNNMSTFSNETANKFEGMDRKVLYTEIIKCYPLNYVLEKNISKNQKIDFMNVDVEGLELEVLESNNWDVFRPKILLVEDLNIQYMDIDAFANSDIIRFLKSINYNMIAKTPFTLIFEDLNSKSYSSYIET